MKADVAADIRAIFNAAGARWARLEADALLARTIQKYEKSAAKLADWLETNLPHLPVSEVPSTARAAELCADDPSTAAIASELAG